jgi:DNA-binding XRE family transcriptional regulator
MSVGSYRKLVEDFVVRDGFLPKRQGAAAVENKLSSRKISALRNKLGLSKPALARQIGVNVNTLWRWERGERTPHGLHRTINRPRAKSANTAQKSDTSRF